MPAIAKRALAPQPPPAGLVEILPDPALPSIARPLAAVGDHAYVAIWPYVRRQRAARRRAQRITRELAFVRDDGHLLLSSPPSASFAASPWDSLPPPSSSVDAATDRSPTSHLPLLAQHPFGTPSSLPSSPPVPDDRLWSATALQRYLDGERPDPADVFRRLALVLDHFIDFTGSISNDPAQAAELLAAYLLTTWLAPAFPALPLFWITGDHGAGKSRLLYLLSRLAHLGLLFPALPASAALCDLASLGASLALDDADIFGLHGYGPQGLPPGGSARQALLLAGRQRGALLPASQFETLGSRRVRRARLVDISGPRLFASSQPPHPSLAAFCLVFPLARTADPVRAARDPTNLADWPPGLTPGALVDDLWALALSCLRQLPPHLPLAAQAAAIPAPQRPGTPALATVALLGANLQPWHALLAVASWLDTLIPPAPSGLGLLPRFLALARADCAERPAFQTADFTVLALQALFQCVEDYFTDRARDFIPELNDDDMLPFDDDTPAFLPLSLEVEDPRSAVRPAHPRLGQVRRGSEGEQGVRSSDANDANDANDASLENFLKRPPATFSFFRASVLAAMQRLAAEQTYGLSPDQITPDLVGRLLGRLRLQHRRTAHQRSWVATPADLIRLARAYNLPIPSSLQFPASHLQNPDSIPRPLAIDPAPSGGYNPPHNRITNYHLPITVYQSPFPKDSLMPNRPFNTLGARAALDAQHQYYRLSRLADLGLAPGLARLPFSIKILLEALLRNVDGYLVTEADVKRLAAWQPRSPAPGELPFLPARVIMQDFTGVPCVVDLAAMRDAVRELGGQAKSINPLVMVDLVIDHSVQVDFFGSELALQRNADVEFSRNRERYEFLRWGAQSFNNLRIVPPATGIVHQVNLEYLARGVLTKPDADGALVALPDTLVGTDSHTTMINALGVLGWGVGGIEAEAVMLGQPLYMVAPQVVGFKLQGALREGVTATDLTLTVVQMLRKKGVVDKFVEFYGSGLSSMSLPDRATIANMAPEYGATIGFFPTDAETLSYLRRTGRADAAELVEAYTKAQGLFRTDDLPDPEFTDTLELNLADVEPSLAGPKRPQDRVPMRELKTTFEKALQAPVAERGYGLSGERLNATALVRDNGNSLEMHHGAVVIAAITSCTNTSNPSVMVGAGLLARKAVEAGLTVKPYVKTSMAPGSKVVRDYLIKSGTLPYLEQLGFNIVGYGCTTCFAAGTPVLLGNGTARPIEQMPEAGGAVVFAPTAQRRLELHVQAETIAQGRRECVTLVLQDGRELVCTPDHQLLCADGRWVRADQLVPGVDRLLAGLEAPLDEPLPDEAGYDLVAGDLTFTMDSPHERLRTLAFARLVGHLLSDGSISTAGQGRMTVGQAVDRELVLNDIELITGKRPVGARYDERKWTIVLPMELTDGIRALAGVRVGRRILQPPAMPAFVLDERCPVAVVREYLGGVFGADGQAPILHRMSGRAEDATLETPTYSQTAQPQHVEQLEALMQTMIGLLDRCGVETRGARVGVYRVRHAASSYPAATDGQPRLEVRLRLPDGLSFVERVGYRYCVDKALRASAAAVYWRTVKHVNEQRLDMSARLTALHQERAELSFSQARAVAASELDQRETVVFPHYSLLEGYDRFERLPQPDDRPFRPLHRDSCGFPSPVELFEQLGVREWFAPLGSRKATNYAKRCCVEKGALSLPAFSLGLLERRPAGERVVFDLAVNDVHAFVAGGLCVHNCIGNSGPLPEPVAQALKDADLVSAAVISGNRNFEGRVHPMVKANFLASPPLVVAYALAGTADIDLTQEPLGVGKNGQPVYLRDIWPSQQEVAQAIASSIDPEMFVKSYQNVFLENETWNNIPVSGGDLYEWSDRSTYIHRPPFFEGLSPEPAPLQAIRGGRVLGLFGDSITTDHISPAGNIAKDSPAGRYLIEQGVQPRDFNQYGTRRGNHEVMLRGTFANIRLKNLLLGGEEGGDTLHLPDGARLSIFDAAMQYRQAGVPLVVIAGKEYGTGSSRDWAAKGTLLLGVRAVIAESFERIHRSNLVGMGVLPLVFQPGENAASLGLTGRETYAIAGISDAIQPRQTLAVTATADDGAVKTFTVIARLDTPVEVDYYKNGGILPTVLRNLVKSA